MDSDYDVIVRTVVHAKGGIREAIEQERLTALVNSPAVDLCLEFLLERGRLERDQTGSVRERFRAATLLLILAAMQMGTQEAILEALRLMGTRNVGTRGLTSSQRFQKAGEARRRPVYGDRYYVRSGYAAETQRRLAQEIYGLVTDLSRLRTALGECGDEAVAKYL